MVKAQIIRMRTIPVEAQIGQQRFDELMEPRKRELARLIDEWEESVKAMFSEAEGIEVQVLGRVHFEVEVAS